MVPKAKQTTVKNPTENALVEQIYSTLEDQLQLKIFGNNYIGEVDYLLQISLFTIKAAKPSNCAYPPSQLAYISYRADVIFLWKDLPGGTRSGWPAHIG